MAKKIFFFSLSLLILVLIFLGAYNLAFKNNINDPVADPSKKTIGQEEKERPLFEKSAENPINEMLLGTSLGDNLVYYYSLDDQSLKKATLEGKNKTILMSNLPGEVTRILWSPKKNEALLSLTNNGASLWYLANFDTKSLSPLKPELSRLAWDNFGEKIFYQYTDTSGKRSLNISNPDGSGWKKLTDLGMNDFFLASVPESSFVSFWNRPSATENSSFETIGTSGETRRVLSTKLFGGDYLWSPNGERALASGNTDSTGRTLSLHIIEENGEVRDLVVPTLISKVVWSQDNRTIYYALPGGLPENVILPNEYFDKQLKSRDTFWKIDIVTGKKTRIVTLKETSQGFDTSDLFLGPNEESLYFTDRQTKRLYRIEL